MAMAKLTGATIGPANIVTITQELARDIHLQPGMCGLFRHEDMALEPFECNLGPYLQTVRPPFVLSHKRLPKSKDLVVAFRTGDISETARNGAQSILDQLSGFFGDFRFVWFNDRDAHFVTDLTTINFSESVTDVVAVNFTGGYWYNASSFFTQEMRTNATFDAQAWGNAIVSYCTAIHSRELPRVYRSEQEEAPQTGALMQKIVGSNYLATVGNTSRDVVVLLKKAVNCPACGQAFRIGLDLATAVEKAGNSSLAFYFIDIGLNQIENGFPVNFAPAYLLYPAANKTDVKMLPDLSLKVFTWLTAKYGKHAAKVELPNDEEMRTISESAEKMAKKAGPKMAGVLRQEMEELGRDVDNWKKSQNNEKQWEDVAQEL
jgi:hypothetical protein